MPKVLEWCPLESRDPHVERFRMSLELTADECDTLRGRSDDYLGRFLRDQLGQPVKRLSAARGSRAECQKGTNRDGDPVWLLKCEWEHQDDCTWVYVCPSPGSGEGGDDERAGGR